MHEFSAAISIVETVLQTAQTHSIQRIIKVNVEVGEFTFLVPEQLQFNFEIASRNTILEDALLNITIVPGKLKCNNCNFVGETKKDESLPPELAVFAPLKCPNCGASSTEIIGGKEFVITDIEAEVNETKQ